MANNQTPDKPFKTWEQQMNLLEQKYNLVINDKNFALTALKSLTYYDLVNGYKDSFMEDTQNEDGTVSAKFKPDISMEFLYYLCLFDKNFQATLFQYSTIIETSFKTKMAYVISKEFGVFQNDYLNPNNYHKSNNGILFSKIKSSCVDAYSNPHRLNLPTKHYVQNHNHVPAWILFKNVSFSNIINLFQLLKRNEKEQVANLLIPSTALSYDEKTKLIIDSLNMVRSFRNTIAHNLKFVTFHSKNRLQLNYILKVLPPELITANDYKGKKAVNDIYADILAIVMLLDDPVLIFGFLTEVHAKLDVMRDGWDRKTDLPIFEKYRGITNLPENIIERLDGYLNKGKSNVSNVSNDQEAKRKHCYVATSTYRDAFHPNVVLLRDFRDNHLRNSLAGRLFIKLYYTVGPYMAYLPEHVPVIRKASKILIDSIVMNIKSRYYK